MVQSASVPVAQRATNLGVGAGEPLNIDEDVSVGASEDELSIGSNNSFDNEEEVDEISAPPPAVSLVFNGCINRKVSFDDNIPFQRGVKKGRGYLSFQHRFQDKSPFALVWELFQEVFQFVVMCTNLHFRAAGYNGTDLTVDELMAWHGIRIYMGLSAILVRNFIGAMTAIVVE